MKTLSQQVRDLEDQLVGANKRADDNYKLYRSACSRCMDLEQFISANVDEMVQWANQNWLIWPPKAMQVYDLLAQWDEADEPGVPALVWEPPARDIFALRSSIGRAARKLGVTQLDISRAQTITSGDLFEPGMYPCGYWRLTAAQHDQMRTTPDREKRLHTGEWIVVVGEELGLT